MNIKRFTITKQPRNRYGQSGNTTIIYNGSSGGGGGEGGDVEHANTANYATNAGHATNADYAANAGRSNTADQFTDSVEVFGNTWYGNTPLIDAIINVLTVTNGATIEGGLQVDDIESENITNSDTITTKDLVVTGQAHFFELVIDKIKSVGGSALFTPAEGFKVLNYSTFADSVKIAWSRGENSVNMWEVGDLALCMNFKSVSQGYNQNARNKYWWAKVIAKGSDTETHYIVISTKSVDHDGTISIDEGDDIVQCGHIRQSGETEEYARKRGNAIYIAASNSLDAGLTAPLYAQYRGINSFALAPYRATYFDANNAEFVGNFKVSSGKDIEDYIKDTVDQEIGEKIDIKVYTYYKYSTGAGGTGTVSDVDSDAMNYIGICITTSATKPTDVASYSWSAKGETTTVYKLIDIGSYYIYKSTLAYKFQWHIARADKTGTTLLTSLPSNYYHKVVRQASSRSSAYITPTVAGNTYSYSKTGIAYETGCTENWVTLQLFDNNNDILDSIKCGLVTHSDVTFEVNNELGYIKGQVSDNTGHISTLQQTASEISSTVETLGSTVSQISQKSDEISSTVETLGDSVSKIQQKSDEISLTVSKMPDNPNVLYNDDPIHEECNTATDLSYFKGVNGKSSSYVTNNGKTIKAGDEIASAAIVNDDSNVTCPYEDGKILRLTLKGQDCLKYDGSYETNVRGSYLSDYFRSKKYKNCDSSGWVILKPNTTYTLTAWYAIPNKSGRNWWSLANSWNFKFDLRAYCQNDNHNLTSTYYVFKSNTQKMTDVIKEPNKFYPVSVTFTTTTEARFFNLSIGYSFTAPANATSYNPTIYFSGYKLEEGGNQTGSALDFESYDSALLNTGINIINRKITLTADNLVCKNNAGQDNLTLDANGNLTVYGSGKFGNNSQAVNIVLDTDNRKFSMVGAKAVKSRTYVIGNVLRTEPVIPLEKFDDSTPTDYEFVSIGDLSDWSNGYAPTGGQTMLAPMPNLQLKTPLLNWNNDTARQEVDVKPTAITFKTVTPVGTDETIISPDGLYCSTGRKLCFPNIAMLNNYNSNQDAKDNGLVVGDVYHTNGVLKIVY